jgi:uncharacterized protein
MQFIVCFRIEAPTRSRRHPLVTAWYTATATFERGRYGGFIMDDSVAVATIAAIREGDLAALKRLVEAEPGLAASRLNGVAKGRTPLHIVSDWPGYSPNGPAVVALLIDAGANPNAGSTDDENGETPLHWAASSDDADVARALIDGGADLERPGGSIGTPLDNAIGYGCWHVAHMLVARGARVGKLWHAAALGMLERLEDLLTPETDQELLSQAFWHACAGWQRRAAERLLHAGADLNWVPDYAEGTALDVAAGLGTRQENVIEWLRSIAARSTQTRG